MAAMLGALEITREQLVDLGILVGTDFNNGIKGIGLKKALALLRRHGAIERMPAEVREAVGPIAAQVREVYLDPDVTDDFSIDPGPCDISADEGGRNVTVLIALHAGFYMWVASMLVVVAGSLACRHAGRGASSAWKTAA